MQRPMKYRTLTFLWLIIPLLVSFLHLQCKETPPEPPSPATLTLKAEDASCTEAWLKATTTETPATVRLLRDGQRVFDLRLLTSDSLLLNEGLLPRRTYTYQLQKLAADSSVVETSASVQLTTMDTTSHNFTWQIDTLGVTSSVLYDVAIINDTLAYAVGEMYLRDSTGQVDPQAWNAAKWNGQHWELKRIPFIGPCSAVLYPPLKAIWAFSATKIWVTNGGSIVNYDGANATMDCRMNSLLTGAINKLFATNAQNVYAVGNNGCIVHYNGSTWQRVESGTTLDLYDIYGDTTRPTSAVEVITVAARQFATLDSRILKLSPNSAAVVSNSGIVSSIHGIWFVPGRKYYIVGGGMYRKQELARRDPWQTFHFGVTQYYQYAITGRSLNDVFSVGSFGEVLHFNGWTWRSFREQTAISGGAYYAVAMKNNFVIAVGYESPKGIVARGHRQ